MRARLYSSMEQPCIAANTLWIRACKTCRFSTPASFRKFKLLRRRLTASSSHWRLKPLPLPPSGSLGSRRIWLIRSSSSSPSDRLRRTSRYSRRASSNSLRNWSATPSTRYASLPGDGGGLLRNTARPGASMQTRPGASMPSSRQTRAAHAGLTGDGSGVLCYIKWQK